MKTIGNSKIIKSFKPLANDYHHWTERAKKIGMNNNEISLASLKSDESLSVEVRRREGELREKIKQEEQEKKESTVYVESGTLEFSIAFVTDRNEADLTKRRIELKNGNYLEIYANPEIGMIREFDLNILLTCFKIGQKNNYKEYCVTDYQIAKELNLSDKGELYKEINNSFRRLGACYIETNNWWNPKTKKRVDIAAFHFFQKYEYDKSISERRIKFSEWVEDNIEAKYLKKVDYKKATKILKSGEKVIYLVLIKQVGKKTYYEVSEETVLRWLGKWGQYQKMENKQRNRNIKRYIDPKMEEAVKEMDYYIQKDGNIFKIKNTPFGK